LLLASVEDEPIAEKSTSASVEDEINDDENIQTRLLMRGERPGTHPIIHAVRTFVANTSALAYALFTFPQMQQSLITRDLPTAIRQLRYRSGTHSFVTRGLVVFVMWWIIIPRFLSTVICGSLMILVFVASALIKPILGLIFRFTDRDPVIIVTLPFMAISRAIMPLLLQIGAAFSTL
jgi:hypothetical protein